MNCFTESKALLRSKKTAQDIKFLSRFRRRISYKYVMARDVE